MLGNLVFLLVVELLTLPVFALFFNLTPGLFLTPLLVVFALGAASLAGVGTLFAALSCNMRLRELLLPLLLIPMVLPALISCIEATRLVLQRRPFLDLVPHLQILVVYVVVFVTLSVDFVRIHYRGMMNLRFAPILTALSRVIALVARLLVGLTFAGLKPRRFDAAVLLVTMIGALYAVFVYAPTEREMGHRPTYLLLSRSLGRFPPPSPSSSSSSAAFGTCGSAKSVSTHWRTARPRSEFCSPPSF